MHIFIDFYCKPDFSHKTCSVHNSFVQFSPCNLFQKNRIELHANVSVSSVVHILINDLVLLGFMQVLFKCFLTGSKHILYTNSQQVTNFDTLLGGVIKFILCYLHDYGTLIIRHRLHHEQQAYTLLVVLCRVGGRLISKLLCKWFKGVDLQSYEVELVEQLISKKNT